MISSILFPAGAQSGGSAAISEEAIRDLRIDQVLDRLAAGAGSPAAAAAFRQPLTDPEAIRFRQAVMAELEDRRLRGAVEDFVRALRSIREELAVLERSGQSGWDLMDCGRYLQLSDRYCKAVCRLLAAAPEQARSQGIRRLFRELAAYRQSPQFCGLEQRTEEQFRLLDRIHFCMLLKEDRVRVRPYEQEERLDGQLKALFDRFRQGEADREPVKQTELRHVHHVDAAILELLTHWYPRELAQLRDFPAEWPGFVEPGLERFSEEVCFYLDWLQLIAPLESGGQVFCYPALAEPGQDLCCEEGFDLALALELRDRGEETVPNSFALEQEERVLIVTGPNQGGKTTFARFFGQSFYWTALGCSIPGRRAVLRCMDGLYTHFNREETLDTLNGKLKHELERLHAITERATAGSVVVINEIFASTTLQDAVFLGRAMLEELIALGCAAVCVTFLDELAADSRHTVSMMSTVEPDGSRCFRVVRRPADGLAYAMQLARSYRLDYASLNRRLEQ